MISARVGAIAVVLALCLVPQAASATTPAWRIQHAPTPAGATDIYLKGVSCTSATACTAVGNYSIDFSAGGTVAEAWDGTRWKIQRTPARGSTLAGVSCTSASECMAVGDIYDSTTFSTSALAEVWNGTKWVITRTRAPAGATYSALTGVSCRSATACVAVGIYYSGGVGLPLAEVWNGTNWVITHPRAPRTSTYTEFTGVSCTSATACIAVGDSQLAGGTDSKPLAEAWNGTTWTTQTVPKPTGAVFPTLFGVSCTSSTACTAVGHYHEGSESGSNATLAEAWNGTTWTLQTTPALTGGVLFGVSCVSDSACAAVGFAGSTATAEVWNGATWTIQSVPTPRGTSSPTLFGVSCTSASACTAVGSDNNNSTGHLQALVERYS